MVADITTSRRSGRSEARTSQHQRQRQVRVGGPLVELVEEHRSHAVQRRVRLEPTQEEPLGHDLDAGRGADVPLAAHRVADALAQPGPRRRSAMRAAAARAARRRGSTTTMRARPRPRAARPAAGGTPVVLPVPGGATSTAAPGSSSAASSSSDDGEHRQRVGRARLGHRRPVSTGHRRAATWAVAAADGPTLGTCTWSPSPRPQHAADRRRHAAAVVLAGARLRRRRSLSGCGGEEPVADARGGRGSGDRDRLGRRGGRSSTQGGALVVDVRSVDEYRSGHLVGAQSIPVEDEELWLTRTEPLDRDRPTVVYCRSGRRSAIGRAEAGRRGLHQGLRPGWGRGLGSRRPARRGALTGDRRRDGVGAEQDRDRHTGGDARRRSC